MFKNQKRLRWYERLVHISQTILLLDSYYQNFRDARDTMDRLIEKHQSHERPSRTHYQHHWYL